MPYAIHETRRHPRNVRLWVLFFNTTKVFEEEKKIKARTKRRGKFSNDNKSSNSNSAVNRTTRKKEYNKSLFSNERERKKGKEYFDFFKKSQILILKCACCYISFLYSSKSTTGC